MCQDPSVSMDDRPTVTFDVRSQCVYKICTVDLALLSSPSFSK